MIKIITFVGVLTDILYNDIYNNVEVKKYKKKIHDILNNI